MTLSLSDAEDVTLFGALRVLWSVLLFGFLWLLVVMLQIVG